MTSWKSGFRGGLRTETRLQRMDERETRSGDGLKGLVSKKDAGPVRRGAQDRRLEGEVAIQTGRHRLEWG